MDFSCHSRYSTQGASGRYLSMDDRVVFICLKARTGCATYHIQLLLDVIVGPGCHLFSWIISVFLDVVCVP